MLNLIYIEFSVFFLFCTAVAFLIIPLKFTLVTVLSISLRIMKPTGGRFLVHNNLVVMDEHIKNERVTANTSVTDRYWRSIAGYDSV